MPDILSPRQRSELMSRVRNGDTKPEWILRSGLHRLGFRYRLHDKRLPGSPDLVFPSRRTALFVHGCFWHHHPGCPDATIPRTNVGFWETKFSDTRQRDARVTAELQQQGWLVLVVWECDLTKRTVETVQEVASQLQAAESSGSATSYLERDLTRSELLAVAEQRVRYRIDQYNSGSPAVQ